MKDINVHEALEHLGGSTTLYRSLVKGFIDKYSDIDREIKHALLEGDLEEAHRLSHSMKGLAGNLGATAMRKTAKSLDDRLKELIGKELSQKEAMIYVHKIIVDESEVFSIALKETVSALEAIMKVPDEQMEQDEPGEQEFATIFEPLINALATYNYEVVAQTMKELEKEDVVIQEHTLWNAVVDYINDYEYDEAKDLLIKGVHDDK